MDETPQGLRDRIDHLRQLADALTDQQAKEAIEDMIEELERRLRELDSKPLISPLSEPMQPISATSRSPSVGISMELQ
jgi:hypothetical protein